ncbi:MAG: cation:proton antiporter [Coriobacteriales bacterium]|nr:cation:proton antiporter [Coriobacteriales bacterium]MBQ6586122.1 cation:proton antiporter [Coriobacteriales bacterium]
MEVFISLAFVALIAFVCPIIAHLIPKQPIPETVFLIVAGMLLGPSCAGLITLGSEIEFLSELGLAFLFLLAGYEIDPKSITGKQGGHALRSWLVSFALGCVIVALLPTVELLSINGLALVIALGTTALGTLMPILKERGLLGTRVGDAVLGYGTWGELGPVLAIAILLSTRAKWVTVLVLAIFLLVAVVVAILPKKAIAAGSRLFTFLDARKDSTSQTLVRTVVLLLVGLVALSAIFDLDIVLGAFASGFILRFLMPEKEWGSQEGLEHKLEGIAFGFFIPIFFVVSGARIDITAVVAAPGVLVVFIVMLLLVRAVPIAVSLRLNKATRDMPVHHRATVALYCTTALPLIVAVTNIATGIGAMETTTASVLVAAGAVTVLLMPLLTSVTYRITDAHPVLAAREIRREPKLAGRIISRHWREGKQEAERFEHENDRSADDGRDDVGGEIIP